MSRDIAAASPIAKFVRSFSTSNDGEALAALRALQRVLTEFSADLHLADIVEVNWNAPAVDLFGHKRETKFQPWQEFGAELLKHERDPRIVRVSRKRNFFHSRKRSRTAPTAAQEKWLRDISNRRRRAA